MNKKIESFLQDIHSLPDEKLDTKQLEANLEMLLSSSPEIKADEAFKSKLKARLAGIVEFKQWANAVRKFSYLKVLFPIFACLVLVVWVFSMIDIKLFNWDTSNIVALQDESNPHPPTGISPLQEEENSTAASVKNSKLSIKEKILARAAEQKVSIEISVPSTIVETQVPDVQVEDEQIEIKTEEAPLEDILEPTPATTISNFSTQLKWSPPVNDTPEADLSIEDIEKPVEEEVLPSFIEDLLELGNDSDESPSQSEAQEGEIAQEIFTQSCESFEWQIQTQSGSIICVKDEIDICSQLDYENGTCDFLE